jgi:hypothetical protein
MLREKLATGGQKQSQFSRPRVGGGVKDRLIFYRDRATSAALVKIVSFLTVLWLALAAVAPAQSPGRKPLLFAMLIEDTPVELADGAKWMMDKGDAFPLVMFKEQQTKLVLQLAGTTFLIPAKSVRVLDEKEVTEGVLVAYRRNVESYLDGKAKKWRAAVAGAPADEKKDEAAK